MKTISCIKESYFVHGYSWVEKKDRPIKKGKDAWTENAKREILSDVLNKAQMNK